MKELKVSVILQIKQSGQRYVSGSEFPVVSHPVPCSDTKSGKKKTALGWKPKKRGGELYNGISWSRTTQHLWTVPSQQSLLWKVIVDILRVTRRHLESGIAVPTPASLGSWGPNPQCKEEDPSNLQTPPQLPTYRVCKNCWALAGRKSQGRRNDPIGWLAFRRS